MPTYLVKHEGKCYDVIKKGVRRSQIFLYRLHFTCMLFQNSPNTPQRLYVVSMCCPILEKNLDRNPWILCGINISLYNIFLQIKRNNPPNELSDHRDRRSNQSCLCDCMKWNKPWNVLSERDQKLFWVCFFLRLDSAKEMSRHSYYVYPVDQLVQVCWKSRYKMSGSAVTQATHYWVTCAYMTQGECLFYSDPFSPIPSMWDILHKAPYSCFYLFL